MRLKAVIARSWRSSWAARPPLRLADEYFEQIGGRPNVFSGKPHSVYIPCQTGFSIQAVSKVEIGLTSAPSDMISAPYVITPEKVTAGTWGAANFSRNFHQILTLAGQPDLPARRLIVGETFTPSGNWSTYPPHKHEKDDLPPRGLPRGNVFLQG